jgi:glyoxylase-like metal-dependent hydrolase (beta-lactamase superfamily II)
VAGDARRQRAADRPAAPGLHGSSGARVRSARGSGLTERLCIVDVGLDGLDGAIGATFLVDDELVLVDPGPSTGLGRLEERAAAVGLVLGDVRHLFLTHVHLDHAGAAGHLAAANPRLRVHVHIDGAPHIADPERLVSSTRRTFGDAHDRLWGEVRPVPRDRIHAWSPGDRGPLPWLRAIPTPGHAGHHISYLDETDGTLVAGDALGILLDDRAPVHPATPPPGVDVAAWMDTLERIRSVGPDRAVWTHFGLHDDPVGRAAEFSQTLRDFHARVSEALARGDAEADADAFEVEVRDRLRPSLGDAVDRYFDVFAAATDYAGMRRFVHKHPEWRS